MNTGRKNGESALSVSIDRLVQSTASCERSDFKMILRGAIRGLGFTFPFPEFFLSINGIVAI